MKTYKGFFVHTIVYFFSAILGAAVGFAILASIAQVLSVN